MKHLMLAYVGSIVDKVNSSSIISRSRTWLSKHPELCSWLRTFALMIGFLVAAAITVIAVLVDVIEILGFIKGYKMCADDLFAVGFGLFAIVTGVKNMVWFYNKL